jgi:hypothetical protein
LIGCNCGFLNISPVNCVGDTTGQATGHTGSDFIAVFVGVDVAIGLLALLAAFVALALSTLIFLVCSKAFF